ncbi:MAG TPA: hypothetical protein VI912_01245 [Candidatus Bilamarchaeaceae archaeon]|nr:hypothetical protein [Candidatus Bilamarchaeaceae archaeon]
MKKVILDTNFLLIPYQFKIDVFLQIQELISVNYELIVSTNIVSELKNLSTGKGKEGAAARFALKLLDSYKVTVVNSPKSADDWIVEYSKENEDIVVCTSDFYLKKKLKNMKKKIISLRTRSRLKFV